MSSIVIRFMGIPTLLIDGEEHTAFRSRRALGLLAYLVCQKRPILRSELVELLWPDKDEKKGRGNLRWAASYISKLLPNCIERTRQTIQFVPSDDCTVTVDIFALDAALKYGDMLGLPEKVSLMQGEFMQGVFFDESAEFETWIISQREHWQQSLSDTLAFLIQQLVAQKQYKNALKFAQQWTQVTPWEEVAHKWVIDLFARLGHVQAALDQYEQCRQRLDTELGIEPSPKTVALFERVKTMRNETAYTSMIAVEQSSLFVGRTQELSLLMPFLSSDHSSQGNLIVVSGASGCGKTRLVHEISRETTVYWEDGVFTVPLTMIKHASMLPELLLHQLFVHDSSAQTDRIQHIGDYLETYLHNRNLLLILDDVPDPNIIMPIITHWMDISPRLSIIITCQHPFFPKELDYPLNKPCYPIRVEGLSSDAAAILLQEAAAQKRFGFQLYPSDKPSVRYICYLLDHMPDAILLIANLIHTDSFPEIAQALGRLEKIKETEQNKRSSTTNPAQIVAQLIWEKQSQETQEIWRNLACFTDAFTLESAAHMIRINKQMTHIDANTLRKQAGMLFLQSISDEWYTLPAPLKQYVMVYHPVSNLDAHYEKQAEYIIKWLLAPPSNDILLKIIHNIDLTWNWVIDKLNIELIRQMSIPYANLLDRLGLWQKGYDAFHKASRQCSVNGQSQFVATYLLYGHGLFALRLHGYEEAKRCFLVANSRQAFSKSDPFRAMFAYQSGVVYASANLFDKAYHAFRKAYRLSDEDGDQSLARKAAVKLLRIAYWTGRLNSANQWQIETGSAETMYQYHFWLAYFALATNDNEKAAVHATHATQFADVSHNKIAKAYADQLQASLLINKGELCQARELLRPIGRSMAAAYLPDTYVLCELARLERQLGNIDNAQRLAQKICANDKATHKLPGVGIGWLVLGEVYVEQNQMALARHAYHTLLTLVYPAGLHLLSLAALGGIALVAWYEGRFELSDRIASAVRQSPHAHINTIQMLPPIVHAELAVTPPISTLVKELTSIVNKQKTYTMPHSNFLLNKTTSMRS